ncbi:MAG: hypothetical protein WDO06_03915 [Actinomycetota bacterium]
MTLIVITEDIGRWRLILAAQVSAFRADKADQSPIFWSDVITEAKKKKVLWPYKPVDVFSTFATLMAQKGSPLAGARIYADEEVAMEVLEFMIELGTLVPEWCAKSNPIDIAEILATTEDYVHAVALYGYSNYSRQNFRKYIVHYDDIPSFDGRAGGSQLGGAGIAVSSATKNAKAAGVAATLLAMPEVQSSTYGVNSGQPGNLVAWKSAHLNDLTHGFFTNTLRTLERAWVRPRLLGWPDVQYQSSLLIHSIVKDRRVTKEDLISLNALYEKYIQE